MSRKQSMFCCGWATLLHRCSGLVGPSSQSCSPQLPLLMCQEPSPFPSCFVELLVCRPPNEYECIMWLYEPCWKTIQLVVSRLYEHVANRIPTVFCDCLPCLRHAYRHAIQENICTCGCVPLCNRQDVQMHHAWLFCMYVCSAMYIWLLYHV